MGTGYLLIPRQLLKREGERHRDRQTDRDRERKRQREKESERERDRERKREREKERERERLPEVSERMLTLMYFQFVPTIYLFHNSPIFKANSIRASAVYR